MIAPMDLVTLAEAAAVFGILTLEWYAVKLEKASYELYKTYFEERRRWYQARRKENSSTTEPTTKQEQRSCAKSVESTYES